MIVEYDIFVKTHVHSEFEWIASFRSSDLAKDYAKWHEDKTGLPTSIYKREVTKPEIMAYNMARKMEKTWNT